MGTHVNTVLRGAISAIWRSQAAGSTFSRRNPCSQAGKNFNINVLIYCYCLSLAGRNVKDIIASEIL